MSNTTTFAKISIQTFRPLRVVLPLEELTADFHQF